MIVNQGTITANVAGGTLTLGGPGFTNQGRITVGQGETLVIAAQAFSNTGSIPGQWRRGLHRRLAHPRPAWPGRG